ncbi:MAG: hypothetical protein MJY63_03630 [Paludibacteraceae bacterium]|nr:hypothetical protein [Paludibacteraceae bacterium]
MRKLLSLSLGLLTAASSFAAVKTVTIPAVPDGKRNCSFVVNEIPDSLGLTDLEYEVLNRDLKGKVIHDDSGYIIYRDGGLKQPKKNQIEIIVTDSLNTVNDTIICDIFYGKTPRVSISDTTICAQAELRAITLPTYERGSYWGRNKFTNEMEELPSFSNIFFVERFRVPSPDSIIWLKDYIAPNDSNVAHTNDVIFDNPSKSSLYLFTIIDTITGCEAATIANITVKDCSAPVMWQNYDGPKEINVSYESEILSILNKDSIIATNPMMNCICPLPLDTIFESTQSDDIYSCGYFKYDVNVKLAASGDTITAYIVHVSYPALPFEMAEALAPNNMGNCIFTVPEFYIPEPDCICPIYFYLSDMTPNAGDTITKDTPIIFTFSSVCGDTIMTQTNIILPKLSVNVQAVGDTVYAQDSLPILSKEIVDITAERWMYNKFTQTYEYGPVPYILDVYRDSIISENKVFGYGIPESYKLDNGNKSADYYYVATDTLSGCQDTAWTFITVLSIDTTSAPVIPVEISEVKGDVYTITGILVKKDVYLKEVMNDLKDGLYIFNKQKILIRRKE